MGYTEKKHLVEPWVVVVVVLTCAFNKGVCPSMPTSAPNYGHVPVDMALKNPHVQAAWTCPHAGKHRESHSRVLPALRLRRSAIRAHKAVSATNARFPNSVVTYGNEHMSTKHEEKQRNPCPQQRIRIPTRTLQDLGVRVHLHVENV